MRTRLNTRFLTVALAAVAALLIPTAAFAYAPSGDDFITCVAGGDLNVECSAGVFDPNSDVGVLVEASVLLDTTVTADADGVVEFDFDVPADHPDGQVKVTLTGTFNGEPKTLADEIATIEDGEVIANAGSNAGLLAIGAVGAIALGGVALFASRRKRSEMAA